MSYYIIQYNIGNVYKGKSVTENAGRTLEIAKK
jgi:hypothetical protein